jgi:hypothetical protein
MIEKRTPERKRDGNPGHDGRLLLVVVSNNRPDTGRAPGRESALTRSGERVERKMTEASEPEDKLDITTVDTTTAVAVNGPQDAPFNWHAIDWRRAEDEYGGCDDGSSRHRTAGDPKKGPHPVEVDAPLAREHGAERAAGDGAQRRSPDGGRHGEVVLTRRPKRSWVNQNTEPFEAMPVGPTQNLRVAMALMALKPCVLCGADPAVVGVHIRGGRVVTYSLCADCCDRHNVIEEVEAIIGRSR